MNNLYAFTGASGVGKSTLLQAISRDIDIDVVELSGRPYLPQNGADYIANKSDLIQYRINYGTMVTMMETLFVNRDKFFSRCAIDRLAYSRVLNVGGEIQDLMIKEIETVLPNIRIYYIPVEFPLPLNEKDEIRGKDEHVRKLTDIEIMKIIDEFKIPVIEVRGTVEKRLKTIYNTL